MSRTKNTSSALAVGNTTLRKRRLPNRLDDHVLPLQRSKQAIVAANNKKQKITEEMAKISANSIANLRTRRNAPAISALKMPLKNKVDNIKNDINVKLSKGNAPLKANNANVRHTMTETIAKDQTQPKQQAQPRPPQQQQQQQQQQTQPQSSQIQTSPRSPFGLEAEAYVEQFIARIDFLDATYQKRMGKELIQEIWAQPNSPKLNYLLNQIMEDFGFLPSLEKVSPIVYFDSMSKPIINFIFLSDRIAVGPDELFGLDAGSKAIGKTLYSMIIGRYQQMKQLAKNANSITNSAY